MMQPDWFPGPSVRPTAIGGSSVATGEDSVPPTPTNYEHQPPRTLKRSYGGETRHGISRPQPGKWKERMRFWVFPKRIIVRVLACTGLNAQNGASIGQTRRQELNGAKAGPVDCDANAASDKAQDLSRFDAAQSRLWLARNYVPGLNTHQAR